MNNIITIIFNCTRAFTQSYTLVIDFFFFYQLGGIPIIILMPHLQLLRVLYDNGMYFSLMHGRINYLYLHLEKDACEFQ